MRTFNYTSINGDSHQVYLSFGKYANNQSSLQVIDVNDGDPVLTASVCVPSVFLNERELIIKDYSENEGVLDFLIRHNIVLLTKKTVSIGYVNAPIVLILPTYEWF